MKTLSAGLGFPALFAVYTLWFAAISPDSHAPLLNVLASVQFTAIMTVLLLIFCLPHIAYCLSKADVAKCLVPLSEQLPSIVRLSLWTLLGPAQWATAVALLEPTPATWLELGLIPLFTLMIGGFTLSKLQGCSSGKLNAWNYVAIALLIAGVSIIFIDIASLSFFGLSLLFGLLGALSTALAGREIERITSRSEIPFSVILFSRFFLTAAVFSAISLTFDSGLYSRTPILLLIALGLALFVLPNYLYVYLIWRTNLRHSAYMWALLPIFISVGERLSGFFVPILSLQTLLSAGTLIFAGALCNLAAERAASNSSAAANIGR